jgi:catechol 2,3-dioxygenase-like lactoylglutathione lyase family enzyme
MKTHISLHVTDLDAGVRFYSTLLGAEPVKAYDDYALFVTEEPGLELALNRAARVASAGDAHYGIAVDSKHAVEAAIARLRASGFPADVEVEETCCYAKQTKVWTRDPDGRRWEAYVVLEEVAPRDARGCCAA